MTRAALLALAIAAPAHALDTDTTVFALYLAIAPADGPPVMVYGGVLMTAELCAMAGRGIETSVEAAIAEVDITFACVPQQLGTAA